MKAREKFELETVIYVLTRKKLYMVVDISYILKVYIYLF